MHLIYIPKTVDDDELSFAASIAESVETLELAKTRLNDLTLNDEPDEAYKLGWKAWSAIDSQIIDLIEAMRGHGWLVTYDLEGRVSAFVRDNLEVMS